MAISLRISSLFQFRSELEKKNLNTDTCNSVYYNMYCWSRPEAQFDKLKVSPSLKRSSTIQIHNNTTGMSLELIYIQVSQLFIFDSRLRDTSVILQEISNAEVEEKGKITLMIKILYLIIQLSRMYQKTAHWS